MGLDIRGYYGVKLVGIREATDEEYEEPLIVVTEYFGAFPDAVKEVARDFSTYHSSFTTARPLWGSVYCRWMEVFGWAAANDGIVVQS